MKRVVITGMGAVTPLGTTLERYYRGLADATPGVGPITCFDASGLPTRVAAEIKDMDRTPPSLDGPWGDAIRHDPKAVFGLTAAREALAHAFGGRAPLDWYTARRVGVLVAAGLEVFDIRDLIGSFGDGTIDAASLAQEVMERPAGTFLQKPAHLAARRIAAEVGARGALGVNVSACAAGTQAIGEAFLMIREGVLDMAVTGGYDSMVNPLGVAGFSLLGALSTQNDLGAAASRPFDVARDGFVIGEGSGMCVIETLEGALARGATIHGEILGFGSTMDAFRVTDPHPDQQGAVAAIRAALASAGLTPDDLDYVNAHGTSTRKNDPSETRAIRAVLGPRADAVPVSSTKSQIGHLIGAAGAVELLAGLFAVREGIIPATINLDTPDPECDLDYVPKTPRPATVDTFLSTSFGFGGQNAAIIAGRLRGEEWREHTGSPRGVRS